MNTTETSISDVAKRARAASRLLVRMSPKDRRQSLLAMADALESRSNKIVESNVRDLEAGKIAGLSDPMLDRLRLDHDGVMKIATAVREVAEQQDVLGGISDEEVRPNGLKVGRMKIPLGVVAMIYESRPNVTSDAAALCLKAGNAVILRGGSEAFYSNRAIAEALREGLALTDTPPDAIQLIQTTDRSAVNELIKQDEYVDLVIPRGGEGLIRAVTEASSVPVLQHYKGVCHVFVDKSADLDMAKDIVVNAKVQRPGVCNALETLLIHSGAAIDLLPPIADALIDKGVEIRGCPRTKDILGENVISAEEEDWGAEYLELVLAIRLVDSLDEAVAHIATYGSAHTEAIVTQDDDSAKEFVSTVQSSTVLVNASTRFADGGELGLGAEIGISTSKLHAFGPMGAGELTTKKFVVFGDGQVRN